MLAIAGSAAGAAPGTLLGGGFAGSKPAAGAVDFVTIRISRDGNTLHFYGDWPASCSSGRFVTASVDRIVALRPDGSFAGSGRFVKGEASGRFRFSGSLDTPTAADGTGEAELRAHGETCTTGGVAWGARATPQVTGTPRPLAGFYFGNTALNDPVVLRLASRRRIVQAAVEFSLACPGVRLAHGSVVFPDVSIDGDGAFAATQRAGSRFAATIAARFGSSTVGGTLDIRVGSCESRTTFAAGR